LPAVSKALAATAPAETGASTVAVHPLGTAGPPLATIAPDFKTLKGVIVANGGPAVGDDHALQRLEIGRGRRRRGQVHGSLRPFALEDLRCRRFDAGFFQRIELDAVHPAVARQGQRQPEPLAVERCLRLGAGQRLRNQRAGRREQARRGRGFGRLADRQREAQRGPIWNADVLAFEPIRLRLGPHRNRPARRQVLRDAQCGQQHRFGLVAEVHHRP